MRQDGQVGFPAGDALGSGRNKELGLDLRIGFSQCPQGVANLWRRGAGRGDPYGAGELQSTAIPAPNSPNNVLTEIYEGLFNLQIAYSQYLRQHFPVQGLLKTVVLVSLLLAQAVISVLVLWPLDYLWLKAI